MARITQRASVGWVRDMRDLSAALRGLASKKTQAQILRRAVAAACKPILTAARRYAKRSEDTGALRDSLTIKAVEYPQTGVAVGLVGPDGQYRVKGRRVGRLGTLFGGKNVRRPANYAHLVEFGHRVAKGGSLRGRYELKMQGTGKFSAKGREIRRLKRGRLIEAAKGREAGFVPARPFLRPAVITTRQQQAAAFEREVAAGLDRELRKMNRRAGTRVKYVRPAA